MSGETVETVETTEVIDEQPEWNGIDEMESVCMICGGNGITRLMIHKIPNFKELIIASFRCNECEEFNNEVTFGGEIQLQGCIIEITCTSPRDLDRQIVKADSASVTIPHLEFEIPAGTQKGQISTIEGFISTAAKNLSLYQRERLDQQPEVGAKVADIIFALSKISGGVESAFPFTMIVNDVAGNSYIENSFAPQKDPNMTFKYYYRTPEQDISLGLQPNKGSFKDDKDSNFSALMGGGFGIVDKEESLGRSEVIAIPGNCPNCGRMGDSLTAITDIPHFKEVIIMAFTCEGCGFRNNEVKGGGAVPTLGTEVTLLVEGPEDLKRDVLKSDSAMVILPELVS
jgi:zinc finger protein